MKVSYDTSHALLVRLDRRFAHAAEALLLVNASLSAFMAILAAADLARISGYISRGAIVGTAFEPWSQLRHWAVHGSQLVGLACGMAVIVWCWRARANLDLLGARGMKYPLVLSVAAWFIPVANLWLPCSVVSEIWRASDPTTSADGWKYLPAPRIILAWWLLLLFCMLDHVRGFLAWVQRFSPWQLVGISFQATIALQIAGSLASIAASILLIVIIRHIHASQESRAYGAIRPG